MRNRLRFLVCGAQKSGTTALAAYLRQHQDLPTQGERTPFFRCETQAWPEPDLKALRSHFQAADADQLWGEATPISLYWDPAPERIWRYNSAMRLLVILRNPIEQAYSHWAMEHRRGDDRCHSTLPSNRRKRAADKPYRSNIGFFHTSTAAFIATSSGVSGASLAGSRY